MFRIEMLPAREGDCLWIEYGDPRRPRRILIDGGRQSAYDTLKQRFAALPADQREFELLMLSHVDADHIEGLLKLVDDPGLPVTFKDVWFNGRKHLSRLQDFGAGQGERFSRGIERKRWPWNAAFEGASVVIPDGGDLPVTTLADGMRLTLLSPTWEKLAKLAPVWDKELAKAGLEEGVEPTPDTDPPGLESFGALTVTDVEDFAASRFKGDDSAANGSSIAVLAEFDGKRAILTGDAHAEVVAGSLGRLRGANGPRLKVDAYKLSHHGSRGTHSVEVMRQVEAARYLISSDGSRHNHPHVEAIARTVKHAGGAELWCNYASEENRAWDIPALRRHFDYALVLPDAAQSGIASIDL